MFGFLSKRKFVQIIFSIVTNSYLVGFIRGTIYKGPTKALCVPGLSCYSCPGALGSCPIGSLQAVLGSIKYKVSAYVTGFLLLFGIAMGRFICGWLCPFGLIQELLYKLPSPKYRVKGAFRNLKYLKYGVLLVFVILLPILLKDPLAGGDPYFCKWICPAGTLMAGLPLLSVNKGLRSAIGFLFTWKMFILIVTIVACIVLYRSFCRFLCPLGALYALFNKYSFYRFEISHKCTHCGKCYEACPIDIYTAQTPNSPECIRCGKCRTACPHDAILTSFEANSTGRFHTSKHIRD